jgi:hypothetical protein
VINDKKTEEVDLDKMTDREFFIYSMKNLKVLSDYIYKCDISVPASLFTDVIFHISDIYKNINLTYKYELTTPEALEELGDDEKKLQENLFGATVYSLIKIVADIYKLSPSIELYFQSYIAAIEIYINLHENFRSKGIKCEYKKCRRTARVKCPICGVYYCRYHGGSIKTLICKRCCLTCVRSGNYPEELEYMKDDSLLFWEDPYKTLAVESVISFVPIEGKRDLVSGFRIAQKAIDEGMKEETDRIKKIMDEYDRKPNDNHQYM